MAIEDLAKKYDRSIPNFQLVKYYEAAIPQYFMDMVITIEKEKPLSILQEFILKFVKIGISDIKVINSFLGINKISIDKAIADLRTMGLILLNIPKLRIRLTDKGEEAIQTIKTIHPEEIEYSFYMDSFTGEIYIDHLNKYTSKDLKNFNIFAIPPLKSRPILSDIKFEEIKEAITRYKKDNYIRKDDKLNGNLIDITSLDKVYTKYTKVSVLVFYDKSSDKIDLRIFKKNIRYPQYETLMLKMMNNSNHIIEFDKKDYIDMNCTPKVGRKNNFWRCSFFMTKYSDEFKLKAIKLVLSGDSICHVAKILNMPSPTPIHRWLAHYENGGALQLFHKNRKYPPIFKQKVIEYRWKYRLSLDQTAAKFSIPSASTISTWEKLYRLHGFSGLLCKKRGRASMKKYKSKNKSNKHKKELSYVEQLEQENYQLRMENDLLKKWHSLMKQWEQNGKH